jgi:hypothetical protein
MSMVALNQPCEGVVTSVHAFGGIVERWGFSGAFVAALWSVERAKRGSAERTIEDMYHRLVCKYDPKALELRWQELDVELCALYCRLSR